MDANVHRSPFTLQVVEPESTPTKPVNKQLYNSKLAELDPEVQAYLNDPERLHGSENNPPNFTILHEKPEHRFIVYLKAQGLSNREVAQKQGYTEAWVSQICRQPWFRARLLAELRNAGQDQIRIALQGAALDSVFTLISLRDDEQTPKAVRKAAADSILDRFLGKPKQVVENSDKPSVPSTPEISALDDQIQQLEKQLNESGPTTT